MYNELQEPSFLFLFLCLAWVFIYCICICRQKLEVNFGDHRLLFFTWDLLFGLTDWPLGCRCNSLAPTFPTDTGSQFIVLSGAASMLQAWQLGRIRGQWRERLNRPASLCFGLPLGEQVSLPHLLVTLISYPRKTDRAFRNHESKHILSLFRRFHQVSEDRCEKTNTGSSSSM